MVWGGAERQICDLADGLSSRGHHVIITYILKPAIVSPRCNQVEVVWLGGGRTLRSMTKALISLTKIIKTVKPDVVHSHMFHANILTRLTQLISKTQRVICTAHSNNEGDNLITKIEAVNNAGDITQDRALRWEQSLEYISAFGYGTDIYSNTSLEDVHNNYIGQALLFGWVGSSLFFIPILIMCLRSFYVAVTQNNLSGKVSFFCSSYFLIYSFIETGAAIFVLWIGVIAFGITLADKTYVSYIYNNKSF